MAGTWGRYLRVSIFGESHGPAIGVTVDGLPAGLEIDMEEVARHMARRAPGQGLTTTARKEPDAPRVLSGIYRGRLTGTPVCAVIENRDQHSQDYPQGMDMPRPGHADYTGHLRYFGFEDPRGGGHFSGRITAPIVFAGSLVRQWLEGKGVSIAARPVRIGQAVELPGQGYNPQMEAEILEARSQLDSVGGIIECVAAGLPAGLGAPFFDSAESLIAHLLFSVPGVKGVEFGLGFAMGRMRGSQVNDPMAMVQGKVVHLSNHSGGALGGITNGEDLVFRAVMRPTASIAQPQRTVSLEKGEDAVLTIRGRHDPCIVMRALPVVESMAALALGEMWKEREACRA